MEAALAELELVQTEILQRISKLEQTILSVDDDDVSSSAAVPASTPHTTIRDTEARLSNILRSNGVNDFQFKKVPSDYYDWPLESRRDVLAAASIHHLCKSIVLVRHFFTPHNIIISRNFYLNFHSHRFYIEICLSNFDV